MSEGSTVMRDRHSAFLHCVRHTTLLTAAAVTFVALVSRDITPWPQTVLAQGDSSRRFDVVSIRRNTSGAQGGTTQGVTGRYTATNISIRMLIRNAFRVLESQIIGGPTLSTADYMSAEKFDITATFTGQATPEDRAAMLRNMLIDRFKLVTHRETRELPVFALITARQDGRLGPQLKPAADPACDSAEALKEREASRGGPPMPAPGGPAGGRGRGPNCGGMQFGPGSYIARSVQLSQLVTSLANQGPITGIDRVVIDRTGLTGRFDFELSWRPPAPPAGLVAAGGAPAAVDLDRPDLFVALQEQLGLKLDPQRAPVDVLIIDSVAMPTEN
jgi:uncharacterized protein (TIGR03435 family)